MHPNYWRYHAFHVALDLFITGVLVYGVVAPLDSAVSAVAILLWITCPIALIVSISGLVALGSYEEDKVKNAKYSPAKMERFFREPVWALGPDYLCSVTNFMMLVVAYRPILAAIFFIATLVQESFRITGLQILEDEDDENLIKNLTGV